MLSEPLRAVSPSTTLIFTPSEFLTTMFASEPLTVRASSNENATLVLSVRTSDLTKAGALVSLTNVTVVINSALLLPVESTNASAANNKLNVSLVEVPAKIPSPAVAPFRSTESR